MMINRYRVDRNNEMRTPCGMNSILYIGNSFRKTMEIFRFTKIGLNAWGKPSNDYGVIVSEWINGNYTVIHSKGVLK